MNKIFFTIIATLLITNGLLAQRKEINKLLPQLQTAKEDTNKVMLLTDLAREYSFVATDSSLLFANQAIALAEKLNFPAGKINILLILGFIANKSDLKKARSYFEEALILAQKMDNQTLIAKAYKEIGATYGSQGSFATASDYHFKALAILKKLNNKREVADIYIKLANNRTKQKKYDEMIQYGQEAVKIGEEINDEVAISDAYVILGNYYAFVEKNIEKGLPILEKSLKIRQKRGNKRGQISLIRSIGSCYKDEKKYDLARKYYQKALQIADELKDKQAYCFTLCGIGDLLQLQNKLDSSIYYYEQSLTISNPGNYYHEKQRAFLALHKAYSFQKKFEKGYEYANLYHSLSDSITNIDNAKKIKEMQVDFELEKKEKEILLLNTKNELQAQESQNQKLLIFVFAFGLLALTVVALLIFRNKEKEKKAKQTLQQKNEEIKAQNEEITQQNEEISMQAEKLDELNKMKDKLFSVIAHDLRSPISSLKNTLHTSHLELLNPEDLYQMNLSLSTQLTNVDNTLDSLLQWARIQMSVVKISPQNFPLFAITDEIVSLLQDAASKKIIEIENEIPENLIVHADINHTRVILRNLLANAVKFSYQNGKVLINTSEENINQVTVFVKDEGTGMSAEQTEALFTLNITSNRGTAGERGTGLGLILCKEFVEKNGGMIWAESEEGKGSTFFFTIKKSTH